MGQKETVYVLLGDCLSVNTAIGIYNSVLWAASTEGFNETVEQPLQRGSKINRPGGPYRKAGK